VAAPFIPKVVEFARLRAKNQITIPEPIVTELGAKPDDRFLVYVQEPDEIVLRRTGGSLAGRYRGMWGDTDEEIAAHLQELRDEWDRSPNDPG
jgi:bifunctional DNA-binding transcriptional regulator/antitoxin component of YhaV-PrlF toxin-antitoxin module